MNEFMKTVIRFEKTLLEIGDTIPTPEQQIYAMAKALSQVRTSRGALMFEGPAAMDAARAIFDRARWTRDRENT